jgi:hypothetical protein
VNAAQWRELVAKTAAAQREHQAQVPPQLKGAREIKFCVDCLHHSFEREVESRRIRHFCRCPALLNPVTGEPSDPWANRNNALLCTREARFFCEKSASQVKEAAPPAPVDAAPESEPCEYVPPVEIMPACIRRRREAVSL